MITMPLSHNDLYTSDPFLRTILFSMSPNTNQDPEKADIDDGHASRPQHEALPMSPQTSSAQEEPTYGDSGPLFKIYSKSAEERDIRVFERWQKEADGLIFFNTLFSAVIAAVVVISVQDLKPDPQETSAFYLQKMYHLQAGPNISQPSVPSTLTDPSSFSPPTHAIWVNSLWFLSLVISLSCAMLATSLQQWARHYIRITQESGQSPRSRARKRAFFADGLQKYHVPRMVETLPILVHLSLFVFFAGLLIYLFNINHTVFSTVMCWIALLTVVYGCITFMPLFWLDCPYYSPLSQPAWSCYIRISYLVLKLLYGMTSLFRAFKARDHIRRWIRDLWRRRSLVRRLKTAISKQAAKLDLRILQRTISHRREDDELEKAIESIPGFFKSNEIDALFDHAQYTAIGAALGRFLHYTLSSNSVPEDVKTRRLATCLKVAGEVLPPALCDYGNIFSGMIHASWDGGPECIRIGHYLMSWYKTSHRRIKPYIRGVIAVIVASVRERHESNESWVTLARNHLGIGDDVFQEYLQHGDSVLLANLIHFSRHRHGDADRTDYFAVEVVRSLSRFDTRNTHPDLKTHFYAVWNDVVLESQNGDPHSHSEPFLKAIRRHHRRLYHGADAGTASCLGLQGLESSSVYTHTPHKSSQSLCSNAPGQRSYPMQHIHGASVARPTPLSPTTSFFTARALSPTPSFLSNNTTTHHADYNFPPSPRIPSVSLSRQVSQNSLSPTTPPDSATITSAQTTARYIYVSSPVTSEPDPSTPVASPPIPELVLTPSDDDAGTTDSVFSSPSRIPIVSLLPSPPPRTSDMPPTDPVSSPTPSSSQFDKLPPEKEPPSRSSTTSIPIHIRRSSQDDDLSTALSVAKYDASRLTIPFV